MTREFLINALTERNIKAEATEVVKNGVILQGIIIGDGKIRPSIYEEFYSIVPEEEVDMAIMRIMETVSDAPTFEVENLANWDWAKSRLQLCLQQKTNEPIVKRDFLDMEQYVRVLVNKESESLASFKVKPDMLEKYGITEDVLFHAAIDCTRPEIIIEDTTKMIAEMMGITAEELAVIQGINPPMIMVTNKVKTHGAVGICFTDILQEVADTYKKDLAILPSSIHECILYPVEEVVNFLEFDRMVHDVNETQLEPEEVLSNHAYRFIRSEGRIIY